MTCGRCGSVNSYGAKFCNNCGSPLLATPQTPGSGIAPMPPRQTIAPGRLTAAAITAESAKLALIMGLISWVLCGFPTGIPAVVVGRRAIKQIEQSRGRLKGREIALAGVIMGYVSCALWLVFLIGGYTLYRTVARQMADSETNALEAIRQINDAEASYSQIYSGNSGRIYAGSLATLGPGPGGTCAGTGTREYACLMNGPLVTPDCREPKWCILKGYKFQLQFHYSYSSRDGDYVITATPVDEGGVSTNFCSTSDRVIREDLRWRPLRAGYSTDDCLMLKPAAENR